MTLTIPATDLAKALSAAASIVETKNMLPILAMVKLDAADGNLTVTTSNLDVEYRQTLPADIEAPFSCCVDAKRLAAMASAASGNMTMSLDGHILSVKAKSRWKVPAIPADDFPLMPASDLCKPMALNPGPLVKRLLWAASTEPTRAYLSGVFMNAEGGNARFVATNAKVLTSLTTGTKWPAKAPDVILAPSFLKALPDGSGMIQWDDKKAQFTCGSVTVTGKMIDGTYPDYRRVFPAPCEPYAVDADEFLEAVRCARIASDAKERKLRVKRQDASLSIRIEGTDGNEGDGEIQADCVEGFEMGVNADQLVAMLAALDADAVTVEHANAEVPILMRPVSQPADMKFEGIIMPMRI